MVCIPKDTHIESASPNWRLGKIGLHRTNQNMFHFIQFVWRRGSQTYFPVLIFTLLLFAIVWHRWELCAVSKQVNVLFYQSEAHGHTQLRGIAQQIFFWQKHVQPKPKFPFIYLVRGFTSSVKGENDKCIFFSCVFCPLWIYLKYRWAKDVRKESAF